MLHVQLRHGADASRQAVLRRKRYGTVQDHRIARRGARKDSLRDSGAWTGARAGVLREESIAVPKEYLADHIKG